MIKRALFSVYCKEGTDTFAQFLQEHDYQIISTGGTFRFLKENGINVEEVSSITGFPEILDGRVKTLHPIIHAGILGMRHKKAHTEQMKSLSIFPIDFVVVNLYPFEETIKNPASSFEDIIEQIDIGGVALIRAAAKNYKDVCIVVDNTDFSRIMEELRHKKKLSNELKLELAAKAFSHTAYYDGLISTYFNRLSNYIFPKECAIPIKEQQELRYGENPHQKAKLYRSYIDSNISTINASILWGKEMSYNNFMDADGCLDILREFFSDAPFAVIIKHTNPCGAALGKTLEEAYSRALSCDPISAFGGIVGLNRKVDIKTASKIAERFYEIIVAPDYDEKALEILKSKKNLRILKINGNEWNKKGLAYRRLESGFLAQEWDNIGMNIEDWKIVSQRRPSSLEEADLKFAWKICKYVKSNAIVYVKNLQTIGIGAGQMSRVDSARIAIEKAKEAGFSPEGSVMASDAFFPFRDSVDTAARNGIKAIIQPGGSIKDEDSIKASNEHGIAMVFTGIRHFRH